MNLKVSELKAGDVVVLDGGFSCAPEGRTVLQEDEHGLWFPCAGGDAEEGFDPAKLTQKHYVAGQVRQDGTLVGMSRPGGCK